MHSRSSTAAEARNRLLAALALSLLIAAPAFGAVDSERLDAIEAQVKYEKVGGVWYQCDPVSHMKHRVVCGRVRVGMRSNLSILDGSAILRQRSFPRIEEFRFREKPILGIYYVVNFPDDLDVMDVVSRLKQTGLFARVDVSTLTRTTRPSSLTMYS